MADLFKKLFYTGVGLVSTTAEKLQTQVDDLVKQGNLSKDEGRKIITDFIDSTGAKREEFENKIKELVTNALDAVNLPNANELKELMNRIEKLEAKMTETAKKTAKKPAARKKASTTTKSTTKTATAKAKATAKKVVGAAKEAKEAAVESVKK